MSDVVKVQINLKDGTFSVEAPADSLEKVFSHLEKFIPSITQTNPSSANQDNNNNAPEQSEVVEKDNPQSAEKSKAKKPGGSKKAPERLNNVELKLSQEQREQFKEFYTQKKPGSQNDLVLVVMYFLIKETKETHVSKDEIFTGIRTVGEKAPTRLSSVLTNLKLAGKILSVENGKYFKLHHTGEDYVNLGLPKPLKKK